jgi:hypothetical protein
MTALTALWVYLQARLSSLRRGEDGWGAVEWMVIMVFVVGLAYAANEAADGYLQEKVGELTSN